MAAATVLRLQTIVSREIAATETAVVTVGKMTAGTAINIIPADAELLVNVRTYEPQVLERVLAAIGRIARGEAAAAGAPRHWRWRRPRAGSWSWSSRNPGDTPSSAT